MLASDCMRELQDFIPTACRAQAETKLQNYLNRFVMHVWSIEDVIFYAEYHHKHPFIIDPDDATDVLNQINIDSEYGVTWDTIRWTLLDWLSSYEDGFPNYTKVTFLDPEHAEEALNISMDYWLEEFEDDGGEVIEHAN